jgi:hypothetical protein
VLVSNCINRSAVPYRTLLRNGGALLFSLLTGNSFEFPANLNRTLALELVMFWNLFKRERRSVAFSQPVYIAFVVDALERQRKYFYSEIELINNHFRILTWQLVICPIFFL